MEAPPGHWKLRLVRWAAWLIAVALAAAGTVLYVSSPGVLSYQVGGLLTCPLLVAGCVFLHRRLPIAPQWVGATALALGGAVGYLIWPNDIWWNFGAVAGMPLVLLASTKLMPDPDDPTRDAWYGGMTDGPWGPP